MVLTFLNILAWRSEDRVEPVFSKILVLSTNLEFAGQKQEDITRGARTEINSIVFI